MINDFQKLDFIHLKVFYAQWIVSMQIACMTCIQGHASESKKKTSNIIKTVPVIIFKILFQINNFKYNSIILILIITGAASNIQFYNYHHTACNLFRL